ncbi:MAG: pantoate--beta-alanine ligase, partial [Proteobacteria bacterium]
LLKRAVAECDVTVLSIFVNPTQFAPGEDYSVYPRTFDEDCMRAQSAGVDIVFAPTPEVIYPQGWSTYIDVENVTNGLCGRYRPGHFRGVATVVYRLFRLVQPKRAYFGQKDLQQCLVINKMVKDLALPVRIVICPTVREKDGLALSSRNRYLSEQERHNAAVIPRALGVVEREFKAGNRNVEALLASAKKTLSSVPEFELQYAEIRSLPNLEPLREIEGPAALAIAGYLGKTRLIDNCLLEL